jgi:rod shape-determining protein MreC
MHDPSPVLRSIVIGVGRRQGVQVSMPVIARNGVAGRIVQVLPTISLVQLLRDPSSRTSVMVKRSRTVGILETHNGRDFYYRYRTRADVARGDTVVTSGLGGVYPAGIGVGCVSRLAPDPDPLFNQAHLSLFVDFDRMEEAFVVRLSPQWSAFRSEVDSLRFQP